MSAIVEAQPGSEENRDVSEINQEMPQQSISKLLAEIKASKNVAKNLAQKVENTNL